MSLTIIIGDDGRFLTIGREEIERVVREPKEFRMYLRQIGNPELGVLVPLAWTSKNSEYE